MWSVKNVSQMKMNWNAYAQVRRAEYGCRRYYGADRPTDYLPDDAAVVGLYNFYSLFNWNFCYS